MKKYEVPALTKAFTILDLVAENPGQLNLADLIEQSKLNKSTVYSILKSLEAEHFVKKNESSTYELDYKIGLLGSKYFQQLDVIREFKILAEKSVNATNGIFQLSILNATNIFYLAKIESNQGYKISTTPGMYLPAHATAMGKVLLSQYSNSELLELYENTSLEKLTAFTVSNMEDLIKQIEFIRENGYFQEFEEATEDLTCIAAPIFNFENKYIAAVSISMSLKKFQSGGDIYKNEIINLAHKLSLTFGFIRK